MSLTLVTASTTAIFASDRSFGEQIDLLNLLFELTAEDLIQEQENLTIERLPAEINIPNIIAIGVPEREGQRFLIGTENYATYEDIQFISDFTGIPVENALIGQFSFEYQTLFWDEYEEELEITEHGFYIDFLENSYQDINFEPFQITGGVVQMGQMVNRAGASLTLGHPNNSSGSAFFTSPHGHFFNGDPINLGQAGTNRIGTVGRNGFGPPTGADFAQVNTSGFGVEVSRQVPWANRNITNFRGIAHAGETARSIRGRSGVQSVRIEQSGFSWTHSTAGRMTNWILVYPDGRSQEGDSGAALIRTNGTTETVLGSRFGIISLGDRSFGAYSSVTSYN